MPAVAGAATILEILVRPHVHGAKRELVGVLRGGFKFPANVKKGGVGRSGNRQEKERNSRHRRHGV